MSGREMSMSFGAVILAAGLSSRMKAFKPLLPVGESTAVERLASSLRDAGIEDIVVVTGHLRERLKPVIRRLGVCEAYNGRFEEGMFSSVQTGLKKAMELAPHACGYFLMPADCPLISSDVIRTLKADVEDSVTEEPGPGTSTAQTRNFRVPVFEGKKGHPLFIPACYGAEICGHDGTGGLKAITDRYWDRMVRIPVGDEGCILDMDTQEGYREILSFLEGGCRREPLEELAAGRRIFLVRHGQTRQHDKKMMIGCYDVPLNDEGREQIRETALQIAARNPVTDRIYASDLDRAEESAHILASVLGNDPEIVKLSDLREINLGSWDGKPVREIREKYPEEYERRGRDIFTFKTGNRAENFYDMQYRAVRALRRILKDDDASDIIIVTHSGVIRALENNLRGFRVDDPWEGIDKGGFRITEL